MWPEDKTLVSDNEGYCSFPICKSARILETREQILLLLCPAYLNTRLSLITTFLRTLNPHVHTLFIRNLFSNSQNMTQFLLDPSSMPEVIKIAQLHGSDLYRDIFYIGRTWCFSHHRERSKRLGKLNFMWDILLSKSIFLYHQVSYFVHK